MSMSNYPNGFPLGVSVRGLPVLNTYSGSVFWVSSTTGSDAAKGTRERPFATLDYAIGRCTAGKGDIIMVMPGHSETITGAGGITGDVSGITIVGMGSYNQRPRFLMDAGTTVSFVISAADTTVRNMVFASGHSNVVTCFNITAKGARILDVDFVNNTTNEDFLTPIKATSTTDNNADGLTVAGCKWITSDSDDLEFIELNANVDGLVVRDNVVVTAGTASPLILCATGKLVTGALIENNKLQNKMTANELFFSNDGSTNTGLAVNNYVDHRDVTSTHDVGLDGSGIGIFGMYSNSTASTQGGVIPAADTNS